jgi:flagellar biosynthesis/type III secretory pathway chaperone
VIAPPPLAEIIRNEAELYERVLRLLGEEEQALVHGRTAAVADCVTRKENLVVEIRLVEIARQTALLRLARENAGPADDADDPQVAEARDRLLQVLPRVLRLNRHVAALLDRSLARLHSTLEVLHDSVDEGGRYRADADPMVTLPSAIGEDGPSGVRAVPAPEPAGQQCAGPMPSPTNPAPPAIGG